MQNTENIQHMDMVQDHAESGVSPETKVTSLFQLGY